MKRINLFVTVIMGGALLLPSLGQSQDYRREHRSSIILTEGVIDDSDTPHRADVLVGTAPEEAECTPACPQGQICKWKSGGGTYCDAPDIVINCPDNDPLCGIDD